MTNDTPDTNTEYIEQIIAEENETLETLARLIQEADDWMLTLDAYLKEDAEETKALLEGLVGDR